MCHVEHGRVIFVDEHHRLLACLLVGSVDEFDEEVVRSSYGFCNAPFLFLLLQSIAQVFFQLLLLHVLSPSPPFLKNDDGDWLLRAISRCCQVLNS